MNNLIEELHQYIAENYTAHTKLLSFDEESFAFFQTPLILPQVVAHPSKPAPSFTIKGPAVVKAEPVKAQTQPPPEPPPPPPPPKPLTAPAPVKKEWSLLYKKIAPQLRLHLEPPIDTLAQQLKVAWRDQDALVEVPIFIDDRFKEHAPFLTSIAAAITAHLLPSKVLNISTIEKENRWENLLSDPKVQLVLMPETLLFASKHLLPHYAEYPAEGKRLLGGKPLLLLAEPQLYYKAPAMKKALWQMIQALLKPPTTS